ncbi:MAG: ABC transporter substrate-binding protein [Deinococcales bacterium]
MKKIRYFVLFGVALAGGIALLAAQAQSSVTLRIGTISVEQEAMFRELEKDFNKKYPQWTIRFELSAQDAFDRALPLAFQSGDAPDILLNRFSIPVSTLRANGWLAPLSEKNIPTSWRNQFPNYWFVPGWNVFEGKVWGVSLNDQDAWGPGYFYYNKAVLKKAGLDENKPPKTWNEWLNACEAISKSGASCITASFQNRAQFERLWAPLTAVAQSSNPFNYRTGRFAFADPDRLRAWTFLKTLYDRKYFIPGVETATREASRQVFGLNQAAFYVDGAMMPSVWRDSMGFKNLDYGVAAMPVPDSGLRGKLTKSLPRPNLFVTSRARNKEAAWAFVQYMTDPKGLYAKLYVSRGYGFLSFVNNESMFEGGLPALQTISSISKNYRTFEPNYLLACPDMSRSTALSDALRSNTLPEENASVIEALIKNQDWSLVAQRLTEGRQKLLEERVAAEKTRGLSTSMDYFRNPNYRFGSNFGYSINYPVASCKK